MLGINSMTQKICIVNQKGGVGKTTTAINLSAALALSAKKTLIVDCDPQGNATTGIGIDKNQIKDTLYHGLIGEADINNIICQSNVELLDIIPSKVDLIGFEIEMMSDPIREQIPGKQEFCPGLPGWS